MILSETDASCFSAEICTHAAKVVAVRSCSNASTQLPSVQPHLALRHRQLLRQERPLSALLRQVFLQALPRRLKLLRT